MKHYLFEAQETGEEFIVGADDIMEAREIAMDSFGEYVRFMCTLTEMEAEASGLDEY